jgi:succinate dehydrogenase / fumarate reductase flavoprotein subunit
MSVPRAFPRAAAVRRRDGCMRSTPQLDRLNCDVLVIGGGFAGAWAALGAAEAGSSVILVDKAFVSRSGASTVSGGVTTAPLEDGELEEWVEEVVRLSDYTADEDWTRQLLLDQTQRVRDYEAWGVPIVRDTEGRLDRRKSRGMVKLRCIQYAPKAAMEALRERAVAAGARVIDRLSITELLTSDAQLPTQGVVCGAIGFDTRSGQPVVINAKNTILTTGPQSIKGFRPIDNVTGDGFAMGYQVGARCADMEFAVSGTFSVFTADGRQYRFGNFNVALAHGAVLVNRDGHRFMEEVDPERLERSELNRVVAAFIREIREGRGPVYIDLTQCDDTYWAALVEARGGKASGALLSGEIPDPREHPLVIEPSISFWNGGKGGFHIDLECRTSLGGLYAAGGVARNSAVGRHSSAGTPTAWCKVSGYRAGAAAGQASSTQEQARPPEAYVEERVAAMLAPLGRIGAYSTDAVHERLARITGTTIDLVVQNGPGIERSLVDLAGLVELLPEVTVEDPHELVKFHEAEAALEGARLVYVSMLDRTESRESFYREDYPVTDNGEWRVWHTMERTPTGDRLGREPIPHDRYTYRPPATAGGRKVSPLASILGDPDSTYLDPEPSEV